MEYLIGLAMALGVAVFGAVTGFDRERCFYPVVLIVVATYYIVFAAMDSSGRALGAEIAVAGGFSLVAVLGFKWSPWIAAAGIAGHGILDLFHHLFIDNPGVPTWWPGFCLAFDVALGALLAVRLMRRRTRA